MMRARRVSSRTRYAVLATLGALLAASVSGPASAQTEKPSGSTAQSQPAQQGERFGRPRTDGFVKVEDKDIPAREVVGRNVVTAQNETVGEIVAVTPNDVIIKTGGLSARTIGVEIAELRSGSGVSNVLKVDPKALDAAPEVQYDSSQRSWQAK